MLPESYTYVTIARCMSESYTYVAITRCMSERYTYTTITRCVSIRVIHVCCYYYRCMSDSYTYVAITRCMSDSYTYVAITIDVCHSHIRILLLLDVCQSHTRTLLLLDVFQSHTRMLLLLDVYQTHTRMLLLIDVCQSQVIAFSNSLQGEINVTVSCTVYHAENSENFIQWRDYRTDNKAGILLASCVVKDCIVNNPDKYAVQNRTRLHIVDVTVTDGGEYGCVVQSNNGSVLATYRQAVVVFGNYSHATCNRAYIFKLIVQLFK